MANQIQIKRSTTNANPTGLANGELAYTSNGDVFFIGSPNGSVVAIGGARFPGVLTANQALVANSSSAINEIRVASANLAAIYANGSVGTSGQVLTSNGANLFWATPTTAGVTGSNTQIQFNDSGLGGASDGFTFNKTTNTVSIGSGTVNATIYSGTANNANNLGGAAASVYVNTSGNFTIGGNLNLSAANNYFTQGLYVGSNVTVNTTSLYVGNTTVNTNITAGQISLSGATINSTSYGGTANNATNLGGQSSSYYTNATNISTGTLAVARGGTAQNSYSVGDILVASGTSALNRLTLGSDGYVLQSNGTTLVYGTLDGGSF